MLYLSLEDTEWPWVALVCMQTVVLMPVGIAPRRKIYVEIAPPSLNDKKIIIIVIIISLDAPPPSNSKGVTRVSELAEQ